MQFCDVDNFYCACPFCANDMSKWSWWHVLCFVPLCHACLRSSRCLNLHGKSATCYKLLLLVVFMPCLQCDNLLHVYPNEANDMSTCSSWNALHVGCFSLHDRFHLAMFISFAKCYVAVMSVNLLRDASLRISLLLMCLSPWCMLRCFGFTIMCTLLWCKPLVLIFLEVT